MICLDNSEWMRNGDYSPTRMEAQAETVNYIANAKLQDNQESEVGLLSMAGPRVQVHCSMCRSMGTVMTCLQKHVEIGGTAQFVTALKIAQLGLKNRQNKNQKQRIVMFVGSPVEVPTKDLIKLGKNFKKNNVAVDVINFGAENSQNENAEKLEAFVAAINSNDNSHLVNVPPGPHVLADLVLTSSIMLDNPAAAAAAAAIGGAAAGGGGMDAGMDEDLAMAIRMSMEDERQRQEALNGGDAAAEPAAAAVVAAAADEEDADMDEEDEDALLARAIALSMAAEGWDVDTEKLDEADVPAEVPVTPATPATTATTAEPTQPAAPAKPAAPAAAVAMNDNDDEDDIAAALQDPDFLENLLSSVPGMDRNELAIDDILMTLGGGEEEKDTDKKDKK